MVSAKSDALTTLRMWHTEAVDAAGKEAMDAAPGAMRAKSQAENMPSTGQGLAPCQQPRGVIDD